MSDRLQLKRYEEDDDDDDAIAAGRRAIAALIEANLKYDPIIHGDGFTVEEKQDARARLNVFEQQAEIARVRVSKRMALMEARQRERRRRRRKQRQEEIRSRSFEPTISCPDACPRYLMSVVYQPQSQQKLREFLLVTGEDDALADAMFFSVYAQLFEWQFLDFFKMIRVLCDDIYSLVSAKQRRELLHQFFPEENTASPLLTLCNAFLGYDALNSGVLNKILAIKTYLQTARTGRRSLGNTPPFPTALTPVPYIQTSASYMMREILSVVGVAAGVPESGLKDCIATYPELSAILRDSDERVNAARRSEERAGPPSAPVHVVLNLVHGSILIASGRVQTFTIPLGMSVWVVTQATPACVNYTNPNIIKWLKQRVREEFRVTSDIGSGRLAMIIQEWLSQDKEHMAKNAKLKNESYSDYMLNVQYRHLLLDPRVVCLRGGDEFINKSFEVYGDNNIVMLRQNCYGKVDEMNLMPPMLGDGVNCFLSDVIESARMRGAQNLVFVDFSCSSVSSEDFLVEHFNAFLPSRTCLSLIKAKLAGGSRGRSKSKSRSRRRSSRRRCRKRSG